MALVLALVFGIATIMASALYFLRPDLRGRLFWRWLVVVGIVMLTFYLVEAFVRPVSGR